MYTSINVCVSGCDRETCSAFIKQTCGADLVLFSFLLSQHENALKAQAGGAQKPDDSPDAKLGRLKHERVFIPRGDKVRLCACEEWNMSPCCCNLC